MRPTQVHQSSNVPSHATAMGLEPEEKMTDVAAIGRLCRDRIRTPCWKSHNYLLLMSYYFNTRDSTTPSKPRILASKDSPLQSRPEPLSWVAFRVCQLLLTSRSPGITVLTLFTWIGKWAKMLIRNYISNQSKDASLIFTPLHSYLMTSMEGLDNFSAY